ncbi:MAG: sugar phosphate isomerase/epimerase [Clostridia bacterium]|nr:sugar phosphate isomerase/epimerase [Clostridia bacterium]
MKIGVCVGTDINRALFAKKVGYDFVESNCQSIVKLSDDELQSFKNLGIPVLSANCFIGLRVVGDEFDACAVSEYLDRLFERSSYLGMKYLVFGSSGARRKPDNMSLEQTRDQIAVFLKDFVAPRAEKYGIYIAVEPLRKEECNVINTVPQAIVIAETVNSPYIKVLADVKHMVSEDDPLDKIPSYEGMIVHAHTSNPTPGLDPKYKRTYPREGDLFDQDSFFLPLIQAGVEQCAIEADVIDFEDDAEASFALLKKYR